MTSQDSTVWEQRWTAMVATIDALQELVTDLPVRQDTREEDTREKDTLGTLIECLRAFATSQFHFFHDGFFNHTSYELQVDNEFPVEHALGATLGQVSYDLQVIQAMIGQRRSSVLGPVLLKAGKLAYNALGFAIDNGRLHNSTTVLCYFEKSDSIRLIPYAPVALIGIPFTCLSTKRDYLAIPHEVGHYVFWNGREPRSHSILRRQIDDTLPIEVPKDSRYFKWLEEIFADVYGCLVAGVPSALDAQDIALVNPLKNFIGPDDGGDTHPSPVLRPYIYTKVLATEGDDALAWAGALASYWDERRRKVDNQEQLRDPSGQAFSLSSVIAPCVELESGERVRPIDRAISKMLEVIRGSQITGDRLSLWPSRQPVSPPSALLAEGLYADFENQLTDAVIQALPSPPPLVLVDTLSSDEAVARHQIARSDVQVSAEPGSVTKRWQDWVENEGFFPSSENKPPSAQVIESGTKLDPHQKAADVWLPVFAARGWTTKGGNGRWR